MKNEPNINKCPDCHTDLGINILNLGPYCEYCNTHWDKKYVEWYWKGYNDATEYLHLTMGI